MKDNKLNIESTKSTKSVKNTKSTNSTKRMSLLELRDNLNLIDEDFLKHSSIALDFCMTNDPSGEFQLITLFNNDYNELDFESRIKSNEEIDINNRLINYLNKDLCQSCSIDSDSDYQEEYNIDGDW